MSTVTITFDTPEGRRYSQAALRAMLDNIESRATCATGPVVVIDGERQLWWDDLTVEYARNRQAHAERQRQWSEEQGRRLAECAASGHVWGEWTSPWNGVQHRNCERCHAAHEQR